MCQRTNDSWVKPRRIDVANIGLRGLGKFHLGQAWMPTRFAPPGVPVPNRIQFEIRRT
jgi:hypothetical protein